MGCPPNIISSYPFKSFHTPKSPFNVQTDSTVSPYATTTSSETPAFKRKPFNAPQSFIHFHAVHPEGLQLPSPLGSRHACKSSLFLHRCAQGVPARCGYRSRFQAGALRTNVGMYDCWHFL